MWAGISSYYIHLFTCHYGGERERGRHENRSPFSEIHCFEYKIGDLRELCRSDEKLFFGGEGSVKKDVANICAQAFHERSCQSCPMAEWPVTKWAGKRKRKTFLVVLSGIFD